MLVNSSNKPNFNYERVKNGYIGGILTNVQLIALQNKNYNCKYRPICGLIVYVCDTWTAILLE